jgi:hypothetical protein
MYLINGEVLPCFIMGTKEEEKFHNNFVDPVKNAWDQEYFLSVRRITKAIYNS